MPPPSAGWGRSREGWPTTPRGRSVREAPTRRPDLPPIEETDPRGTVPAGYEPDPAKRTGYVSARPDVVVPRVYIEPDEELDRLREMRDKIAIFRDVLLCIFLLVATLYLGSVLSGLWFGPDGL